MTARVLLAAALAALGFGAATAAPSSADSGTTTDATTTVPLPLPTTTDATTTTVPPPTTSSSSTTTTTTTSTAATTTAPPTTSTAPTTAPTTTARTTSTTAVPHLGVPSTTTTTTEKTTTAEPAVHVPQHVEGTFRRRRPKYVSRPLTATPELGGGPYVFPVAGHVDWGDSYGGERSDVNGGWHHGDDLFARLGQPVVAVADGTVVKTGWERLGGWRLWLKDHRNNRFYYAHLSGYTKLAHKGQKVHAGEVLGFIGHTGDAFTTLWHLHFEIHPSEFLYMHYDGAVDPSSYLASWPKATDVRMLAPVPLPPGASVHGEGAVSDYRQLLALRAPHRSSSAPVPVLGPDLSLLTGAPPVAAAQPAAPRGSSEWPAAVAAAAAALALGAAAVVLRRRRPDA